MRCIGFSGGGSGGHCYPLIALAESFKEDFSELDIFFVSTKDSVEERVVPRHHFGFFKIFSGRLNSQSKLQKIATLLVMPLAFLQSLLILFKKRPQIVVGAGGFAGAPFLLTASLLGIPCVIFEQNRNPGLANRLLAKFATLIFLHFADTAKNFPGKKTALVGHPVRKSIVAARWQNKEKMNEDPFKIFIFGGSQGALGINRLVIKALPFLKKGNVDCQIHHQTGKLSYAETKSGYEGIGFETKVEEYVYDMASAYNQSHLVICRAGASSIAELAAAGKAAILIPLESKDRHQDPNAEYLVQKNAGIMIKQSEISEEAFAELITDLINNRTKLTEMSENIKKLYEAASLDKMKQSILQLIG